MVHLIPLSQSAQDRNRVLHRRFTDHDRLESTFERSVFFDVLAVLIERRRADGVQFTASEHRLEQIRRVHRAFALAGADHRVKLVDEENDRSLRVLDFLEDGFEALLEFAAELRAGNQRAHIERDDPLVLEAFGHVTAHDPLRQTLRDRGLADARFADQHRIVLGPAAKYLNDASDFFIATDDRIELALFGCRREVATILFEALVLAFGVLVRDALGSAHTLERGTHGVGGHAVLRQQLLRVGAAFGDPDQKVLGADVFIAELFGFAAGNFEQFAHRLCNRCFGAELKNRQFGDRCLDLAMNRERIDADLVQHLRNDAVRLNDEGRQNRVGLELRQLALARDSLSLDDRFLGFFSECVWCRHGYENSFST